MAVSLKTDLRFPISGQWGHGDRIIQLTEVMHCIKAKDTIVDMQKLIDGVNSQKIDLDSTESDIKAASVYNSAIDDSLYEVKNAVYPNYKAFFVWDNAK